MYTVKKSCFCSFFAFVLVCGLFTFVASCGVVHASTDVPSIINADTVWTKTGSPYELLGPVLVNSGVVLTVEPGTVVNLNDYYIDVNGTLSARGTSSETISFNGGTIQFSVYSSGYDEQTGSGCVIEYADLKSSKVNVASSPKISNNVISEIYVAGSGVVSENRILHYIRVSGSVTVVNNIMVNSMAERFLIIDGSPLISYNDVKGRLLVNGGSPVISYNTFADGIHVNGDDGAPEIVGNIISANNYRIVYVGGVPVTLSGNTITGTGTQVGVKVAGSNDYVISDNTITNCGIGIEAEFDGHVTIERNTITNNTNGVNVAFQQSYGNPVQESSVTITYNVITDNADIGVYINHDETTLTNNTITNNQVGVEVAKPAQIMYNNIYGNSYNLKTKLSSTIDASYNYWGTTNTTAINQTIYDKKYDFTVETVNYTPILTEQNINIPEYSTWTILPLLLTATLLTLFYKKQLNKKR